MKLNHVVPMKESISLLIALCGLSAPLHANMTAGLFAYYDFDDLNSAPGTLAPGLSVAGSGLTVGNVGGVVGKAVRFTGSTGDVLRTAIGFGGGGADQLGNNFTVSAWYRLDTDAANATTRFMVFEGTTAFDVSYGLRASSGTLVNDTQTYTQRWPLSGSSVYQNHYDVYTPGTWQHVLLTYESDGTNTTITTYIDGSVASTIVQPTSVLSDESINIGNGRDAKLSRVFDGLIDEFAAWSRILDSNEIAQVRQLGLDGKAILGNPMNFTVRVLNEWEDTNQSGLTVTAYDESLGGTYSGTTDANGLFTFNGQPGPYTVTISRGGLDYPYPLDFGDGLTRETFVIPEYRARWTFDDPDAPGRDLGREGHDLDVATGIWMDGKRRVGIAGFDGSTQWATGPAALEDEFTDYSISLWFKADSTAGPQVLFEQGGLATGLGIRLVSDTIEARIASNGSSSSLATPFSDTAAWHHLVLTFSPGVLKLYLDGTMQSEVATSINSIPVHSNSGGSDGVGIAQSAVDDVFSSSTAHRFSGKMDDIRVYKMALTPGQIAFVADQVRCISAMYCRRWGILNLPIEQFGHSDELLYSFIRPNPDGSINYGTNEPFDQSVRDRLVAIRDAFPSLKMVIAVSGNEKDNFGPMCADANARNAFVANLVEFCNDEGFSGINFDYEFPYSLVDKGNYVALLTQAKPVFAAAGLSLTQAIMAWNTLPESAYTIVDGSYLMAYDLNWKVDGAHHSSYDDTVVNLRRALSLPGMLRSKLVLGLPFYGQSYANGENTSITYRSILATSPTPAPEDDWAGVWGFNGQTTIAAKTDLATASGLRGVMAWDLQSDTYTQPERSLVRTVEDRAGEP